MTEVIVWTKLSTTTSQSPHILVAIIQNAVNYNSLPKENRIFQQTKLSLTLLKIKLIFGDTWSVVTGATDRTVASIERSVSALPLCSIELPFAGNLALRTIRKFRWNRSLLLDTGTSVNRVEYGELSYDPTCLSKKVKEHLH